MAASKRVEVRTALSNVARQIAMLFFTYMVDGDILALPFHFWGGASTT